MTGTQRTVPFQTLAAAVTAPGRRGAPAIGRAFYTLTAKALAPASFTWGIWAVMLLGALWFVAAYGTNLPYRDDFALVPSMTGHTPWTITWLWTQQSEHRIPLARLTLLLLYKLTNNDFRAGMYFSVLLLAAIAFAMIIVAQRIRSRPRYTDAIFPLALLHWGHSENLLWSIQVSVVIPIALACCLLLIIVTTPLHPGPRRTLPAGLCLLLLPLNGAYGVVFTPLLALWLAVCGACQLRTRPRSHAILPIILAGTAVLLDAAYFIHYQSHPHDIPGSLGHALTTSLQVLSLSFGPAADSWWPYSGVLMASLLIVGAAGLGLLYVTQPQRRLCAFGLLCFATSFVTLAVAIAWGRPNSDFTMRYTTLVTPVVLCTYFIYQLNPGGGDRFVSIALFTLVSLALPVNTREGVKYAEEKRDACLAFARDVQAGVPCLELATRYSEQGSGTTERMIYPFAGRFSNFMCMLHSAGVGPFRELRDPRAYDGNHQVADRSHVGGWVVDCRAPDEPVEVDICEGDRVLARARTDEYRDLSSAGFGKGRYGFDIPTPASLRDGRQHIVRVRVSGTDLELSDTPRVIPHAAVRPSPHGYQGYTDPHGYQGYTDCEWVSGWARDRDQPDAFVEVDVYDGSVLLGTTRADQFRQYLHDTGVGTARYGFDFLLPTSLRDGKPHSIRVRIHGTNIDLVDTPKTITCPPQ